MPNLSDARLVKEGLRSRKCTECEELIIPHDSFYSRMIPQGGGGSLFQFYHLECWERLTLR